jgi:hypothetical protein
MERFGRFMGGVSASLMLVNAALMIPSGDPDTSAVGLVTGFVGAIWMGTNAAFPARQEPGDPQGQDAVVRTKP